jgi:maltose/moltooligosaccharide transporter
MQKPSQKPRLGRLQIWNMCFGFLGVQIGFGLQNANASRIFQTLGADIDRLAVLWIAAPVTGLLVQPLIGHLSDKTWGPLGRRRPYFLVGAICAAAALAAMPFSPALWVAAILLWIIDASVNITMEPFRAFVGDLLPDEQRTAGFAMQSVFIGSGAVAASALPWVLTNGFGISNAAPPGHVPLSVVIAFVAGAAGLLSAVLWTVFTTREYSPSEMAAFATGEEHAQALGGTAAAATARPVRYGLWGALWMSAGAALSVLVSLLRLQKEVYILGGGAIAFGLALLAAGVLRARKAPENGFSEVMDDLLHMPKVMAQLAVVQFFSWFGLFAMWIYSTPAVARHHFGAPDASSPLYNQGADWVGVLFAVYNGAAVLAAFLLPRLAARCGRRGSHALSLALAGLGLASFLVIRTPAWLLVSMVGVGVGWASILSAPYAILSGALPPAKMGVYMGIFNIFIVVPQILAATILGGLLKSFAPGHAILALLVGGASLLLAAGATLFVSDPADPARLSSASEHSRSAVRAHAGAPRPSRS